MNLITSEVDASLGGRIKMSGRLLIHFLKWFHQGHSSTIQMMSAYANCIEEETNEIL